MRRLLLVVFVVAVWLQVQAREFQVRVSRKHVPVKHKSGKRHRGLVMKDVYGSNVTSAFYNIEYKSSISLGTPPQVFTVIMDTGSHILWVPHKGCTNTGQSTYYCPNTQVYDEKKSSTAKISKDPFKIVYGIGTTEGKYIKDVFAFGNATDSSTMFKLNRPITFGLGDKIIDGDQGVLGLSFSFKKEKGTSIFQQMLNEKKLDHPLFTVFYKKCPTSVQDCPDGGVITFGKHDRKNCGPILGWTPQIAPGEFFWKFKVDEIVVGSYTYNKPANAITDTGTSHFRVAASVYKEIIKTANGTDAGNNQYKVPCDKPIEIKIKINGIQYTIPMTNLVVELSGNDCLLMVADRNEDEDWILGDPWIRSYCQVHDWQERKVGFAKPGENQAGEEYTPPPTKEPPTTTTARPVRRTTRPTVNQNPTADCTDKSKSCFNWNRNGFCTTSFFTDDKKRDLCAKTCNMCTVTNTATNTVNAATRRRRAKLRAKQRARQAARQAARQNAPKTEGAKNEPTHQATHQNPRRLDAHGHSAAYRRQHAKGISKNVQRQHAKRTAQHQNSKNVQHQHAKRTVQHHSSKNVQHQHAKRAMKNRHKAKNHG